MKSYYFIFCKTDLMLQRLDDGTYTIPCLEEPPVGLKPWTTLLNVTPMADGTPVRTCSVDFPVTTTSHSDNNHDAVIYEMCPLRQSYYRLIPELYLKAGKCAELVYWDHTTRYCGVCGAPMSLHTDISKRCTQCGKEVWPQLATAVIVLIHHGPDQVLLARGRSFKTDFYGLIAGFVETGETLEEAVRREVWEETGLHITNITYFDSQPWPYPCGLMVGFNADYAGGQLRLQLANAAWFHRDHLPRLPEKLSIARRLIDHWVEKTE